MGRCTIPYCKWPARSVPYLLTCVIYLLYIDTCVMFPEVDTFCHSQLLFISFFSLIDTKGSTSNLLVLNQTKRLKQVYMYVVIMDLFHSNVVKN